MCSSDLWFNPPKTPNQAEGFWGMVGSALDLLSSIGDGIAMMVWIVGLAALAGLASLLSFIFSCLARDPVWLRLICGAPAMVILVVLVIQVVSLFACCDKPPATTLLMPFIG